MRSTSNPAFRNLSGRGGTGYAGFGNPQSAGMPPQYGGAYGNQAPAGESDRPITVDDLLPLEGFQQPREPVWVQPYASIGARDPLPSRRLDCGVPALRERRVSSFLSKPRACADSVILVAAVAGITPHRASARASAASKSSIA